MSLRALRIRLHFVLLTGILFVPACATTGGYERYLATWVEQDVNAVIRTWGPPSAVYALPDGTIMYSWKRIGDTVLLAGYSEALNFGAATMSTNWCQTDFTANQFGKIVTISYRGNSCKMNYWPD